jgi:hypothetical protein
VSDATVHSRGLPLHLALKVMLKVLAATLLLASFPAISDEILDQIPANPAHFGCWQATPVIGIGIHLELCVSAGAISYTTLLSNGKAESGSSTTCNAEGSLAGFSEGGLRMYLVRPGKCSNGGSIGAIVLDCTRRKEQLLCENVDLVIFAQEKRIEYTSTLIFSPRKEI